MSSPNRKVEHAGITWKVVPGSRREQVLLRMIARDDHEHDPIEADHQWIFPLAVGLLFGFCSGMLLGYMV